MRLIDADEFIKSIPNFELPDDTVDACTLRILLRNAPTVDPVNHGHWIHEKCWFVCGNCKQISLCRGKYCINCGSKNDEVRENDYI